VRHNEPPCQLGRQQIRLRGSSFSSRVLGAIVGIEVVIQLALGVCGPFIECIAGRAIEWMKHPSAIRTTPACYLLSFDPCQFAGRILLALMMHTALTSGQENSTPTRIVGGGKFITPVPDIRAASIHHIHARRVLLV
jgi:hypothetical protein